MGTCTVQNVIRHTTKKCMHTHAFYCECMCMKLEVFDGYRSVALSISCFPRRESRTKATGLDSIP